ncbi:MAG: lipid-A-disaccharide synthase [Microcoleaceae cyanobacterium]
MQPLIDILILSNGPGELTTWVRPVVQALRQQFSQVSPTTDFNVRISVVLSPCPHATGREADIAQSYPQVDRVQAAQGFWPFLLQGRTLEHWDWAPRGVVVFLGGDQFFALAIAKRLKYRSVIYAEWDARWWRWIDRFGVMRPEILNSIPAAVQAKFTVVGDLIADVRQSGQRSATLEKIRDRQTDAPLIGLLPGSKSAKLVQGVPLALAIADQIHQRQPEIQFVLPVAPALELSTLAKFADPVQNPVIHQMGGVTATLHYPPSEFSGFPYLKTSKGLKIHLWTQTPAYDVLAECCLCLTTIGANTAELGSLAVPMIVLIPTQQLDAMRAWDGLPGLLANLPFLGSQFARLINGLVLRRKKHFAWPNIWAGEEVVPELIGQLQPQQVAELAVNYLEHPEHLQAISHRLQQIRGEPGAAQKLAAIIQQEALHT